LHTPVVSISDTDYAHPESKTKLTEQSQPRPNAVSFSSLMTTPKDNIGHVPSPIKSLNYRT